ncbi:MULTISPECIES: phosphoglucosamine mutase [Acidiplasma]|uniref:Phosphoglucomutase n=2 Tax=Acidiplasma aeolicum TaxID=507754 RepID=A0A0Q1B379_9ARCH|nr:MULTISPECIES: phosphoglucosamine mutase [Acidiplasma]KJE49693.1 phosphoglucomutase [Acidiplasma sp. MBA-1]KPV46442.1 phosphoglucomutase [Acidiplasma aeolicum]KQB34170.1 phosphoglucomutase [Acidiplasma aeolicum]WMT55631.1 MAG: phosphoglucosamine mutase [Acidiplasma sp.]
MELHFFGTNGIRGIPNDDLSAEFSMDVGKAMATFFSAKKIAMAKDTRITGDMILNAVSSAVMSAGTDVVYLGILPTPALQYYCKKNHVPGIMITASHNPPQYNGIKAIDMDGTEIDEEKEYEIEKLIMNKKFKNVSWENAGRFYYDDTAVDLYINGIISLINFKKISERKLNVAIDTGNGASYYTSPLLLSRLNCHIVTLNSNPDGKFTGRNSEPKPENLQDLINIMKTGKFDIGIAHDGDADRCVFIDENGNFIDGNESLALIAKYTLRAGETLVTPTSSSDALKDVCQQKNAKIIVTRVGAPIVARTMIENNAVIGGEENGGVIYGKHQFCRDGAMTMSLMLNLLACENKKISELLREIPKYYMVKKSVPRKYDWDVIKNKLLDALGNKKTDLLDGIKIYEDSGWVLIRPSGTEKILRIFTESKNEKTAMDLNEKYINIINKL